MPKGRIIKCKKLELWLGGSSLRKKLETLERGKLAVCVKCSKIFYDMEDAAERRLKKCHPANADHECIAHDNYIILKRGFSGPHWVVIYPDTVTPEMAVIKYFLKKR